MKVLLISSYKVSCGIATYAETLETLLEKTFDIEVAALDQSILKSTIPHVVLTGDRQIRDLCATFKNYDVVNLQWEPGILGDRPDLMAKRLGWILEAADHLILTVHTVVPYPKGKRLIDFASFVRRKGFLRSYQYLWNPEHRYRRETYRILQERANSGKNTFVAVHTGRERQFFRDVVGFKDVFDHPLSLVHEDWPARLQQDTPEARRGLEDLFPGRHKFIGVFGFLSEYKGILTALKAMRLLDDEYQLVIYGGVHPNAVKEREPVNSYVMKLMNEMEGDAARAPKDGRRAKPPTRDLPDEDHDEFRRSDAWELEDDDEGGVDERQRSGPVPSRREPRPKNTDLADTLMEKVAFLGAPDDYEFALAMNAVDICIFPYLEVGQSGSGPVSIAVELGKPVIVSRTKAFIEFSRYYPKNLEMVDIGNHIQLAQAIQRLSKPGLRQAPINYNNRTLARFYGELIRGVAGQSGPVPGQIGLQDAAARPSPVEPAQV